MATIKLFNKTKYILDHGFIKLVDCMPRVVSYEGWNLKCDSAIVQAARVSFDSGMKDFHTDKKLIHFLLKHKHTSPFEMVKLKFHIKAPLFVQRQWIRHRMSNVNEISGRYSVLKDEFYNPNKLGKQSLFNKQSSDDSNLLENKEVKKLFDKYIEQTQDQYNIYKQLINYGVSRETARICLPLNMYTEFYWCIDLHNFLNFYKLRSAKNAQYEIRQYADSAFDLIRDICPITTEAYKEYNENSITFYSSEIKKLKVVDAYTEDMSLRNKNDLKEKIDIINNGKNF